MTSSHRIPVSDESAVGQARRYVSTLCQQMGMDETMTGQAAIVASEMAHNLVRHGGGGEMIIWQVNEGDPPALELLALDRGAGMADVTACLRDGQSTGGTMGAGLGSIKRLSRRFEIHSQPGKGTAVWSRLFGPKAGREGGGFEFGGVSVAVEGEIMCGDAWHVLRAPDGGGLRVFLADGLGHGPIAQQAAHEAVAAFQRHPRAAPPLMLEEVHRALMKTRGAAASMVEIQLAAGLATGAGVGNVTMRLWDGAGSKTLVCGNGTLGCNMHGVHSYSQPWTPSSLLVLHSDGLGTQWNLADYPGLAQRHPSLVAGVLYRDFRRQRDDATVVVARHCT